MKEKKRIPIDSAIPNLQTAWDDGTNAYTGYRVEEFIKSQISSTQSGVSTERQERIDAITSVNTALQSGLNTEKSYRESADTTLQSNINTEIQERVAAITSVTTALSTESAQRQSKDTELETSLNTEISNRASADTQLQDNINTKGIVWDATIPIKSGSLVSYNDVLYKAIRDIPASGMTPYRNDDYVRLTQSGCLMMTEEEYDIIKNNNSLDENILYLIEEEDD